MEYSPRRPSSTILIFSSAEYLRRVRRFTDLMCCSALSGFLLIFTPLSGYDEPKTLLKQNNQPVSRLLNRYNSTNGSGSTTSPDHTEPSKEKLLTKRSEKSYKAKIQCPADWSMLHTFRMRNSGIMIALISSLFGLFI